MFWLFIIFRYGKSIFAEAKLAMPARARPILLRIMFIFYGGWSAFGATWFIGPEVRNLVVLAHLHTACRIVLRFDTFGCGMRTSSLI